MSAATADAGRNETPGKKVVRLDRAQAASVALKVAINDRRGKPSPQWMVDVARRMGVKAG